MILPLSNSERKRLLTPMKKTIIQYNMIEEGDRVSVDLSYLLMEIAAFVVGELY